MQFIHPYNTYFSAFCFSIIMMYILNILSAIKKTRIKELKDFIFKSYYRQIEFTKENSFYSLKHQKKKDLILLPTKLIKKYLMLVMLKNIINHF